MGSGSFLCEKKAPFSSSSTKQYRNALEELREKRAAREEKAGVESGKGCAKAMRESKRRALPQGRERGRREENKKQK